MSGTRIQLTLKIKASHVEPNDRHTDRSIGEAPPLTRCIADAQNRKNAHGFECATFSLLALRFSTDSNHITVNMHVIRCRSSSELWLLNRKRDTNYYRRIRFSTDGRHITVSMYAIRCRFSPNSELRVLNKKGGYPFLPPPIPA